LWPGNGWPLLQIALDLAVAVATCAVLYHFVEVPAERALRVSSRSRRPATL
jgi:peptidoglycan/LPS O-acetylase OafA/YrhL